MGAGAHLSCALSATQYNWWPRVWRFRVPSSPAHWEGSVQRERCCVLELFCVAALCLRLPVDLSLLLLRSSACRFVFVANPMTVLRRRNSRAAIGTVDIRDSVVGVHGGGAVQLHHQLP